MVFWFHDMVISAVMLTCRVIANIDLDECIARLYRKELLADSVIEAICLKAKELLMKESNVVHIAAPVTVVGDIHGQFFDMIEIFKIGGFCPDTNYLFLGWSHPENALFGNESRPQPRTYLLPAFGVKCC